MYGRGETYIDQLSVYSLPGSTPRYYHPGLNFLRRCHRHDCHKLVRLYFVRCLGWLKYMNLPGGNYARGNPYSRRRKSVG